MHMSQTHFSPRFLKLENISQHQSIRNFMRNPNMPILIPFSKFLARFFRVKVPRASISVTMAFFHQKIRDNCSQIRFPRRYLTKNDLGQIAQYKAMNFWLRLDLQIGGNDRKLPEMTGSCQKWPEGMTYINERLQSAVSLLFFLTKGIHGEVFRRFVY